jgi:23S rRNA G2445 N2-methylase RlmL
VNAQRCNDLRLTGSGGANRVMEAELKRLVMRSPFDVRLDKPKREGEETLLYAFDARVAWVAACHHRTSSRISWDLCSSPAVRLEPLFADLLPALSSDDRLPDGKHLRFSVEVGSSSDFEASPLQLRGVVKNALVEALASRGVTAEVDADSPDVVFVVRRAGTPGNRRTVVGIDIGGGARHRRGARVAAGPAPLRETMAAQLIMLSRWDARAEPLVDPMAGGGTIPIEAAGLAVGRAIRQPPDLPFQHLQAFAGLPGAAPDLFPGTVPRILALDVDAERIPTMVGNLRAAGLTGPSREDSIVIGQKDLRGLTPDDVLRMLPSTAQMQAGVFCFNPPYGVRLGGDAGEEPLLQLYADLGRALGRFRGWRAACFVANARFVYAFGHSPSMTKPSTNAELPGAFFVYDL